MGALGRGGTFLVVLALCSGCYQPVIECPSALCAPDAGEGGSLTPSGIYDITFACTINCVGTYPHTMTITQTNPSTGAFSGVGVYKTDSTYKCRRTGCGCA